MFIQDLDTCKTTYGNAPGVCYCTQFMDCFHRHFTEQPTITLGAGLEPGRDQGIHDYDYYIEVQVTNRAKTVTTLRKKVTFSIIFYQSERKYSSLDPQHKPTLILLFEINQILIGIACKHFDDYYCIFMMYRYGRCLFTCNDRLFQIIISPRHAPCNQFSFRKFWMVWLTSK